MKRITALSLVAVALALFSCQRAQAPMEKPASNAQVKSGQVHTIMLPRYQANLPEAPGREVFASTCLTCHTPRYVTMQPPLTATQWDAAVHKMIKVYAAPIAEGQVAPIVQYLMATKEKGVTEPWVTRTTSSWKGQVYPVPALSTDPAQIAKDLERGQAVYKLGCYSCHGESGRGDGRNATAQLPHPSDFTNSAYSPEAMASAIAYGVPGTSMPAVPVADQDMRAIVTYVVKFTARPQTITMDETRRTQAKTLFAQNCAQCHGDTGDGSGPQAETQPRPPANFHLKQPGADYAAKVISDGIAGTTMPQWKTRLSADQRQLLADYVRSLYGLPAANN